MDPTDVTIPADYTQKTLTVSEPAGLSKSEHGREVLRGVEAQPAALKAQWTSDFVKVVNTLRMCCECEHEACVISRWFPPAFSRVSLKDYDMMI